VASNPMERSQLLALVAGCFWDTGVSASVYSVGRSGARPHPPKGTLLVRG